MHDLVRPHCLERADLLVEGGPPRFERRAERVVLRRVPADAEPHPQPFVAQQIEGRELLRREEGLALRKHQHSGHEPQPLGRGGGVPEQHEGLIEGRAVDVRDDREVFQGLTRRAGDVVVDHHVVKPVALERAKEVAHDAAARYHELMGEHRADLHGHLSPVRGRARDVMTQSPQKSSSAC
jgi:hypothetical protein